MTEQQQATIATGKPGGPSPEEVYAALRELYFAVMTLADSHPECIAARNRACRVIRAAEGRRVCSMP